MKLTILFFLLIFSMIVKAIPPEKGDDVAELSIRKFCTYQGTLSKRQIKRIKKKAMNGDSIAAHFLFMNGKLIKGLETIDQSKWLKVAEQNGNPLAAMVHAFTLFEQENDKQLPTALTKLKIVAEQGILEAIYYLKSIYEGKHGFKHHKDKELAFYWRERYALSGNLFHLKEFVHDNPNSLEDEKLKSWREAYEYLRDTKKGQPNAFDSLSSDGQWLVRLFNRNKQNLTELLKQHHEVYAGYKYCKNK